jgi:hypothetical protein
VRDAYGQETYEDSMSGVPKLQDVAHRLMTQQVGPRPDPDRIASAAITVYTQLLSTLSPLLGELGSAALLCRSLRLTETAFPCYTEVRRAEADGLLYAVGVCLRRHRRRRLRCWPPTLSC